VPRTKTERIGPLSDPAVRRERARRAGLASHSLDCYVRKLVARAPELTNEQRDKLALLLRSAS
jgi:hypothetical protein